MFRDGGRRQRPYEGETFVYSILSNPKFRKWAFFGLAALVVVGLIAVWQFTPLGEQLDRDALARYLGKIRGYRFTPVIIPVCYILAHAVLFPNTILNAAVILTIGGLHGWLYAMLSSLLSSTLYFFVGRRYGAVGIHAFEGHRLDLARHILRKGGFGAVALVRFVPVAPYTVVNTMGGAIGLRYVDFIIGTFLAHLPGTLTLTFFGEQLSSVIAGPNMRNTAVGLLLLLTGGLVIFLIRRHAHRHLGNAKHQVPKGKTVSDYRESDQ